MVSKNINFNVEEISRENNGRCITNLISNETIIRVDDITMLHKGENIESIFYSLTENNNFLEIEREKIWTDFSKLKNN